MTNIKSKLAAIAFVSLVAVPAFAGKGGSNAAIVQAVQSGSTGAIIAEVERAEGLMCDECIQTVTALTEDSRYEVREVAGWWFAKRPGLKDLMVPGFKADLANGNSISVRNAADFLGAVVELKSLPALRAVINRDGLSSEAKLAIVRAIDKMAHPDGDPVLVKAMTDSDPAVRAAAVAAWRDILRQPNAIAVEPSLRDSDAKVRAQAAAVMGAMADTASVPTLEVLVTTDPDSIVRRNAAWSLGKLGSSTSRAALITASSDKSVLVRGVAKAALATIK
jgi:HEAT repeat protein